MGHQARQSSAQTVLRCRGQDDPHDEIASDILELWIGISRLLAKVSGKPDLGPHQIAAKTHRPPASRKPRRKAA